MRPQYLWWYYQCTDGDIQKALAPIYDSFRTLMTQKRHINNSRTGSVSEGNKEHSLLDRLVMVDHAGNEVRLNCFARKDSMPGFNLPFLH